jgi:hypothetical protein
MGPAGTRYQVLHNGGLAGLSTWAICRRSAGDRVYVQVSGLYNLPAVDRWAVDMPTGDLRMRRLLAVALAAPLALSFASPAVADEAPPPILGCGGGVSVEPIVDTTRFIETKSGLQIVGNGVARVSDGDSSVDVQIPGRASFSLDPATGATRIVLSGQILLIPDTESLATALADAGLPEIALVTGRVVILQTFDEATGTFTAEIVSATPHVTDVCALLS